MNGDDELRATGDDPGDGLDAPASQLDAEAVALLRDPVLWDDPPPDLGERLVVAVRSEAVVAPPPGRRSPSSWARPALIGAAAVVAFLFAGVVALSAIGGSTGADRFSADLVPTGLVADVDGTVEVTSFGSGLRLRLDAPSLPRRENGKFYEAWLRTDDGALIPCGTFHGGDEVTLWAGVELDRVVAFTVTMEAAAMPDSGEQATSGDVVLKADMPAP